MSDDRETEIALYEAERNRAWHSWFAARGDVSPSDEHTRIFDGGFRMAWELCRAQPAPQPAQAPDVAGLVGKMGRLIAAGNRLNAEAEECIYGDGMSEVAGSEYWCEFRDALEAATDANNAERGLETVKAECGLLRAAIRRLCNIYVVDDYYMGKQREERLEEAVNWAIEKVRENQK